MTTIASMSVETEATLELTTGRKVIGGVDTHKDTHTAAVIDAAG